MICIPWRPAASLGVLFEQANTMAPGRRRGSDGIIGDAPHQAEACSSQHNSCCVKLNGVWIIRAGDLTHDPAGGLDVGVIFDRIRASRDSRVRYLIFNDRICYPTSRNGYSAWAWQPYQPNNPGRNKHRSHGHVSVFDDAARFDNSRAWAIGAPTPPGVKPATVKRGGMFMVQREGDAAVYLTNGAGATHIGPDLMADLQRAGVPYVLVNDAGTLQQVCHFADQGADFTPEQISSLGASLAAAVVGHVDTPLGEEDQPAITAAVLDAFAALLRQAQGVAG